MRAFEYDAFISHNSFDGAASIAADLEKRDARVFCDEAVDLSDRRVRARVEQALMRSRCVVLHVPLGFRDSKWCQAEYEPALAQSIRGGVTRVVVARTAPIAPVPASLTTMPVFDTHRGIDSLVEFLVSSNLLPDGIAKETTAQNTGLYGPQLGKRRDARQIGTDMLEVVSNLRQRVEAKAASLPADEVKAILDFARQLIDATDCDSRTNAHRALILTAALQKDEQLLEEIKGYICRELNEDVLKEALWTYLHADHPADEKDKWLAAALIRATQGVKTVEISHGFLDALPEPVRCRVVLGRIGLGGLTVHERMLLLERRLQALVDCDTALEPKSSIELEGSLREFLPHLDDNSSSADIKQQYRRLVHTILAIAERRDGEPVRTMGEHACDVLVEPLARLLIDPDTSLELFEWACQMVEEETGARDLVNRLRIIGHLIRTGVSWPKACTQVDTAWSDASRKRLLVRHGRPE